MTSDAHPGPPYVTVLRSPRLMWWRAWCTCPKRPREIGNEWTCPRCLRAWVRGIVSYDRWGSDYTGTTPGWVRSSAAWWLKRPMVKPTASAPTPESAS